MIFQISLINVVQTGTTCTYVSFEYLASVLPVTDSSNICDNLKCVHDLITMKGYWAKLSNSLLRLVFTWSQVLYPVQLFFEACIHMISNSVFTWSQDDLYSRDFMFCIHVISSLVFTWFQVLFSCELKFCFHVISRFVFCSTFFITCSTPIILYTSMCSLGLLINLKSYDPLQNTPNLYL